MPIGLAGVCSAGPEIAPPAYRRRWAEQIERVAADYRNGALYAACNSEKGAGGSLAATKTIAERRDGRFTLTGEKILASFGGHADMFFSTAKVDPSQLPGCGVVELFLVRPTSPGVQIMNDWDGFGMRSTESQTVKYAAAPAEDIVGFPNFIETVQPLTYVFALFSAIPLGCAAAIRRELSTPAPQSPALRLRLADAQMREEALRAAVRPRARGRQARVPRAARALARRRRHAGDKLCAELSRSAAAAITNAMAACAHAGVIVCEPHCGLRWRSRRHPGAAVLGGMRGDDGGDSSGLRPRCSCDRGHLRAVRRVERDLLRDRGALGRRDPTTRAGNDDHASMAGLRVRRHCGRLCVCHQASRPCGLSVVGRRVRVRPRFVSTRGSGPRVTRRSSPPRGAGFRPCLRRRAEREQRGLHESLGFRPVGVYRTIGYKAGAWHDVGWWHLAIKERPASPQPPVLLADIQRQPGWDAMLSAGIPLIRAHGARGHRSV
jgi:hypothetical protein